MWSGTANGWHKPRFTFDWASKAHELPILDLIRVAGLFVDHAMLALICASCRAHSVSNSANIVSGTAHGEYKVMK